jgi:hypothetical protein
MGAINDIFKAFGPEYLDRHGDTMPDNPKKAIRDMVYKSCGNRRCHACQWHKTRQRLEKQKQRQLPGHHFMITFTMPQEIRDFIRGNQRVCYSTMFKASSDSIKKLARDPKFIGAELVGFFGVLHTLGRQQQYHPHIHYIAPGGAVTDGDWLPPMPISSSRFTPCRRSSGQSSSMKWTRPDYSMRSQRKSGKRTGTSTPRPYRLKSTASSTWPLMSSGLPSPTPESSRSKTDESFSSTGKRDHVVCAQLPSM